MRYIGFPGKRVDPQRAGMMPTALFMGNRAQRNWVVIPSCEDGEGPHSFWLIIQVNVLDGTNENVESIAALGMTVLSWRFV
jgi:hypothetical protein